MSELKPCPICNGPAFYDVLLTKFDTFEGNIACDCGMRGIDCEDPRFDCKDEDQLKAALADHWNNRPYENKIKAETVRKFSDALCYSLRYEAEGLQDIDAIEEFIDKVTESTLERGES